MNTDLEAIEKYVTGQLTSDERMRFEAALRADPAVAEALAFYMLTKQVAKEQAREQRKAELVALRKPISFWGVPMRWAAAASIAVLLGLGWYFLRPTNAPEMATRLADEYIAQHFMQLPTTMDGESAEATTADSLKTAVGLVNSGKLAEADVLIQAILRRQPTNDRGLKYGGIVALRRENYDQAIGLFHRLSERADLYSNPGLFYESLALLKRGRPMDKENAKKLLDEVITRNLEGKREAESIRTKLTH